MAFTPDGISLPGIPLLGCSPPPTAMRYRTVFGGGLYIQTINYIYCKDLSKVPMWRLEWDLNLRPSGRKAPNLPLSHHANTKDVEDRLLNDRLFLKHQQLLGIAACPTRSRYRQLKHKNLR